MSRNKITEIYFDGRVQLFKLKIIDLSSNLTEKITITKDIKINKISKLILAFNNIKDISFLENIEMKN